MNNNIERIKELTKELLQYCHEYYDLDAPTISDAEYDKKFDELFKLENEANFWLANSPTRKVQGQVLECFKKVQHSKLMLSAAKTKDINEIKRFVGNNDFYCSYKLDGLSLVCIWDKGHFKQAITRGTGVIGEDVTEQAKMIGNLPMTIPYDGYLELRGECVVSWDNFRKINESLAEPYSHPRNLAAGSLRNLDTSITKQRNLSYVVFECVHGCNKDNKLVQLDWVCNLGFTTVDLCGASVERCIEIMKPEDYEYPVDGLIFEFCSNSYSKSLSATNHHEGCRMALKWEDSTHETTLRDVIWDVGRSGVINPVAVFDEVDLDGALTTKATLHNLSVIENLELGIGDTITVYRSNMVIPKIDDNLTRSGGLAIPKVCPCCGYPTEIKYTNNSKFLMCTNPNCSSKLLAKFTYFVSRNCANIDGLSEATLKFLIDKGWVNSFQDIYHLSDHKEEWQRCEGFGKKSVENILDAIEKSRDVKLSNFICALSIDGIGAAASKTIASHFNNDFDAFFGALTANYDWSALSDCGEITARNIANFGAQNGDMVRELAKEMRFVQEEKKEVKENPMNGKKFCVTGTFAQSRDILKQKLEALGAIFVNSVSKNLDVLFCGEKAGSKLTKAQNLGVKVVYENELMDLLGE